MKGIILAGGYGTRLYPLTFGVCKQLLPVYDKPMVYYPLSVLMLAGIRDILLISTPKDLPRFKHVLSDGSQLGLQIVYKQQDKPRGLADAFIVGRDFVGHDHVCLILGDNIIHGEGLERILRSSSSLETGARIFGYFVRDPERYGVVDFDHHGRVTSLEEKPRDPKSNYAVPGIYFYDNKVLDIAANLKPSSRNELEITDVNRVYLQNGQLTVELFGRGIAWLDAGTHDSLLEASHFIQTLEKRQGLKVGCVEEVAYRMGFIDSEQLKILAQPLSKSGYGEYLLKILHQPYLHD